MRVRVRPGWPVAAAGAVLLVLAGGSPALAAGGAARPAIAAGYGEGAGFCASVVSSGYDLGAHYDNVYPCGPKPGATFPGYGDSFQPQGGFQCTELANRFLFDAWGYNPVFGSSLDGANYAQSAHAKYPNIPLVANGTAGQPYLPGDIVSFTGNSDDPDGHVAVVIGSTENSSGNGSVTIMEENAATSGQETLTVSGWSLQKASGSWVTPFDFLALQTPSAPPPPPPPTITTGNLLLDGSFWNNQTAGWVFLPVSGGTGSYTAYSSSSAPEGDNYLEFNTSTPDGSVYQDVSATLQPNQSYTFSAWVRANSSKAEQVCLALFGMGPDTQNGRTCRTVHRAWTLISAPYDVGPSGETTLRAQVYLGTTGANCDIAGAELVNDTLLNGSFWDNQTTGWHFLPVSGGTGSYTAYSSSSVPEGSNYLEFNTSTTDGSVYQDVSATLQPNQSYTFSAWVRANSSKAESVCLALFGIGPNTQNGRTCRTVHRTWTLISAPYDVGPSGETDLRAQVYLGTTGANCDIAGAALVSDTLLNGSFWQNQTTGWVFLPVSGGTGSYTAYSSSSVPEGSNYLEFNTSTPDGSVYQDVSATLQPNQSYTFSAWVRANSSKAESVCLALFGMGPNTQNGRTCRTVHRTWTLISAPYDVGPSGETTLRAQVYLGTTGANCDIDGASFAASRPQAPRAPRSVKARAGLKRATVTWAAPSWSGGVPVVNYVIRVSDGAKITVGGSARSVTITGLKAHAHYTFTVTAVNGAVPGNPSAATRRITTT